MSTVTRFLVYGPSETLKRMTPKLLDTLEPKYVYQYKSSTSNDEICVAIYEQFEKQINATITLTCIIEHTGRQNKVELKKAGGRMGFRGSSLSEEKSIDSAVIDFIMDYTKRFGLSLQEDVMDHKQKEKEK
ncbi:MAG: hypothetical protein ACFCU6_10275 [Balneolaceae bacterium]